MSSPAAPAARAPAPASAAPAGKVAPQPLPFYAQFTAGAIAGVAELLCLYPLDVSKTRLQLQSKTVVPGVERYTGMIDVFRKIIAQEGPLKLYRGMVPPLMLEAPKRAVKFASNDFWGKTYMNATGTPQMTQALSIAAGCSAGITEALIVSPIELVKVRLQDKASQHLYKGPKDVFASIYRSEGLIGFANGLTPTILRHAVWNFCFFGVAFKVRAMAPKPTTKQEKLRLDFIAGTLGGTVGTVFNAGFDTVKSRIQNCPRLPGQTPKYKSTVGTISTIVREEGFGALYAGFLPKVARLSVGGGIMVVVVETVLEQWRNMLGPPYK